MNDERRDGAVPKRRLRLRLDLGADDLGELAHALAVIGNDLEHEGIERRKITSGGYASGWHLVLTCDGDTDHDSFVAALDEWRSGRPVSAPGEGEMSDG